jgi:hypothetical protein
VEGQIEQQVAGAGNTHLAQEIAVWLEDEELSGPLLFVTSNVVT